MPGELDNPLFARIFHRYFGRDRGRGETELRQELVAGLDGTVVEVGAGNGINFEHYPASVTRLIAIEPEKFLRSQASAAAGRMGGRIPVEVRPGLAEATGLEDGSVDAIVVSGVLCSVPSQAGALAEFRRVLRPGGELRFYEHVRSTRTGFARWQRLARPIWSQAMAGCQTNRDTLAAIEASGFRLAGYRRFGFPASARLYPVAPRILGVAISEAR